MSIKSEPVEYNTRLLLTNSSSSSMEISGDGDIFRISVPIISMIDPTDKFYDTDLIHATCGIFL